jgi:hypothetical protein
MRNRADRARSFTRVAANANFGIDQVLLDDNDFGLIHKTPFQLFRKRAI